MTITHSVADFQSWTRSTIPPEWWNWPCYVGGRLWIDAAEARLYDHDRDDLSLPFIDPEAVAAVRAVLPPPHEYLGGALMQCFVRLGPSGPELYGVYWIALRGNAEYWNWETSVEIRPVPPEHEYRR